MSESLNNLDTIRQYLLGKISDEKMLEEIEGFLFSDEDFCTKSEIVEDELINDFVFGKLNSEDRLSFEKTLENNADRRAKVKVTQLLKEKTTPKVVGETTSIFDSFKAIFRQPIYAGGFALLLIAILIGAILLSRQSNNSELVELKNIYKDTRPIESRISEFDYAPYEVTRGVESLSDAEKRKLKIIENELLKKVDSSPNANNHNTLGVFYLSQRKYSEAINELQESVKLEPNNAKFHNDLGSAYFEFGKNGEKNNKFNNLIKANESFSKSLEIYPDFLVALFNKSLSLQENKLFNEAKKSWEAYLQKDSTSRWADEARKNLEKIAQIQSSLSKKKEEILQDFLTAFRNSDEKKVWKIHNSTKGLLNQTPLAAQLTNRFLAAKRNKDDTVAKESIEALNYIGKLEKEQHADFFFADLADYYAKVDESKIEDLSTAKNLLTKGFALVSSRQVVKAIKPFNESQLYFKKANNQIEADLAELWSSQMLIYRDKLQESSVRMQSLLEKAKLQKHLVISANLYYWIGNCNFKKGEFSEQLKKNQESLAISRKTQNLYEISHTSESSFGSFGRLGNLNKSFEFAEDILFAENAYHANLSQTRRSVQAIAEIVQKTENKLSTIDFANEGIEISRIINDSGGLNESIRYLVDALASNKKFEKALEIANKSLELALKLEKNDLNKKILADSYQTAADLKSEMKQCESALPDYQKSLEFYNLRKELTYNSYSLEKGWLFCLKQLNRTDELQIQLEKVLNLSEVVRQKIKEDELRQTYFENEQTVFDLAIENAISRNENEKAFNFVETYKSRSLLDFVQAENKSIIEVEQSFNNISKPFTLTEIQAQMPENVQIAEYSVLPNKFVVWVITKNRFEMSVKEIENEKLEQKIKDYQNLIKDKGEVESIKSLAKELYNLLIPNSLENNKILCLIPDKSLHRIPFASLIAPNGKYLVEEFTLLNSAGSSVFVTLTNKAKGKMSDERLLSVGNPKFNREINQNLADLPDAEIEANEISKNYVNSRKFSGMEATKKEFLEELPNAGVIHFAGHFVLNEQAFENSRMLFTDADLFAFELGRIKLPKAKLAVLSACETGLEKLNNSEGAIGIYRTFLAIGIPVVVASNWKVESSATKDLMVSFHKKRKIEKLSGIEALRRSQLEMLQSTELSHPFYWSAFAINGGYAEY